METLTLLIAKSNSLSSDLAVARYMPRKAISCVLLSTVSLLKLLKKCLTLICGDTIEGARLFPELVRELRYVSALNVFKLDYSNSGSIHPMTESRGYSRPNGHKLSENGKKQWRETDISLKLLASHQRPETRQKLSVLQAKRVGPLAPAWKGGISFEKYCYKFNDAFKEYIREKFGRKCYLCPKTEKENRKKLAVHHIDYNKNSICKGKAWAFVPLCGKCHGHTQGTRWYWFNLLINYWAMNPEINVMGWEEFRL